MKLSSMIIALLMVMIAMPGLAEYKDHRHCELSVGNRHILSNIHLSCNSLSKQCTMVDGSGVINFEGSSTIIWDGQPRVITIDEFTNGPNTNPVVAMTSSDHIAYAKGCSVSTTTKSPTEEDSNGVSTSSFTNTMGCSITCNGALKHLD